MIDGVWSREQFYSMSRGVFVGRPMGGTDSTEVRNGGHPLGGSKFVAPPTVPERSTLRLVTPTTQADINDS